MERRDGMERTIRSFTHMTRSVKHYTWRRYVCLWAKLKSHSPQQTLKKRLFDVSHKCIKFERKHGSLRKSKTTVITSNLYAPSLLPLLSTTRVNLESENKCMKRQRREMSFLALISWHTFDRTSVLERIFFPFFDDERARFFDVMYVRRFNLYRVHKKSVPRENTFENQKRSPEIERSGHETRQISRRVFSVLPGISRCSRVSYTNNFCRKRLRSF